MKFQVPIKWFRVIKVLEAWGPIRPPAPIGLRYTEGNQFTSITFRHCHYFRSKYNFFRVTCLKLAKWQVTITNNELIFYCLLIFLKLQQLNYVQLIVQALVPWQKCQYGIIIFWYMYSNFLTSDFVCYKKMQIF